MPELEQLNGLPVDREDLYGGNNEDGLISNDQERYGDNCNEDSQKEGINDITFKESGKKLNEIPTKVDRKSTLGQECFGAAQFIETKSSFYGNHSSLNSTQQIPPNCSQYDQYE